MPARQARPGPDAVPFLVRLPRGLYDQVRETAHLHGVSLALATTEALTRWTETTMQPFQATWHDQHTHEPIPPTAIEDHDAYAVLRCVLDDSLVTISEVGTSRYAECRQGHRWQDTYTGAWIERP
jgi:hypothetical protein